MLFGTIWGYLGQLGVIWDDLGLFGTIWGCLWNSDFVFILCSIDPQEQLVPKLLKKGGLKIAKLWRPITRSIFVVKTQVVAAFAQ